MSRFSVADIINWSYHCSTECSPYSWKLFWHNWFTLTSVYLFIATVSPGQQSVRGERWDMLTNMYPCTRGMHKAQICEWQEITQALFELYLHHQSPAGKKHTGEDPSQSCCCCWPPRGQAQHSFGGAQQLLEQNCNWAPRLLSSKLFFPNQSGSAFRWLKITQVPQLFILVVLYVSILCFPPNNVMNLSRGLI